ncbi:hypothetical protein BDV38DRAFT_278987 [Aspergillus pseudotamarii]|uniref:SMP-30/Gluconolactonase/LRE-like region domain-containing protein n=1 Tax=Aspergillus pseudotamarii TaxID=132259 RepID=A0A5N6T5N9_ASPPS|nr:uncharacterized protein BDV38DRAFT_278987 [Aspergillus pseudotamarii]KAE8141633.1 hypothetical protein BDV38DRAFT_278987 [Aspergillus pseudotamarii]
MLSYTSHCLQALLGVASLPYRQYQAYSSPQAPLQAPQVPQVPQAGPPITTLVSSCAGFSYPEVACIDRYGSLLQGGFERKVRNVLGDADTYISTDAPAEPTFSDLQNADFLVWNQSAAKAILGPNPTVDFMFSIEDCSHEAPVYVPTTNELYFSRLQQGFLPQLVINLNNDPPTLEEKIAQPPIYAATGARFRDGLLYLATIGGNESLAGYTFRPGLYTLNPMTGETQALLNNYYGYYFNAVDDLDIDHEGQIWFTDNDYGRPCQVNTYAPQINAATYRFNPKTGLVTMVDDTLLEPNGLTFSPDNKTVYLTDTGAGSAIIDPNIYPAPHIAYNSTRKGRTIYAYDVAPSRKALLNKRPVYLSMEYAPDGIKTSREGYLVSATGKGIVVLTDEGEPLVRVQTNFTVINIAFAGQDRDELWAIGKGGVARIRWGLKGSYA